MAISQRISGTESIFSDFKTMKLEINNKESRPLMTAVRETLVLLMFYIKVLTVGTWPSDV